MHYAMGRMEKAATWFLSFQHVLVDGDDGNSISRFVPKPGRLSLHQTYQEADAWGVMTDANV